jgi:hypothetical protein
MTHNAEQLHRDVGASNYFAGEPPQQMSVRLQVAAMVLQGLLAQHEDVESGDEGRYAGEPVYRSEMGHEVAVQRAVRIADLLIEATK